MTSTRMLFIDELTRAEAKNARAARQAQPDAPFRKTSQLMIYVRSLLPQDISNAELCRRLQLSDSTRRRLEVGESVPEFATLQHLRKMLSLDDTQYMQLQILAYALHTRLGAVMRCCLKLKIFEPTQINRALILHKDGDTLYSAADLKAYDVFEGDYLDWLHMCSNANYLDFETGEKIKPQYETDSRLKAHFERYSYEVQNPQPLVQWIIDRIEPPMRPGHFYRHCTLPKAVWENLNKPGKVPHEKTLWKVAVGLRLTCKASTELLHIGFSEAEKQLLMQKDEDTP